MKSLALGNFTWDWIYGIYPAFDALAPDVIPDDTRRLCDGDARLAAAVPRRLRTDGGGDPGHSAHRQTIPARSGGDAAASRRLPPAAPSCSRRSAAYGAPLPFDAIRASGQFTLLSVEQLAPHGLLYQDLVAAADVVVSKPGYGIVSECIANNTALLYTSRGRFIEYDVFVAEMPRWLRCRFISQEDLLAGDWAGAISALLAQPDPPDRARVDGAEVAAGAILSF